MPVRLLPGKRFPAIPRYSIALRRRFSVTLQNGEWASYKYRASALLDRGKNQTQANTHKFSALPAITALPALL
jgi:hypothetical protein